MSSLKRRLAAIVFTDIVGFTNLSSKDEEGAYNLVKKQRKILKPIVEITKKQLNFLSRITTKQSKLSL